MKLRAHGKQSVGSSVEVSQQYLKPASTRHQKVKWNRAAVTDLILLFAVYTLVVQPKTALNLFDLLRSCPWGEPPGVPQAQNRLHFLLAAWDSVPQCRTYVLCSTPVTRGPGQYSACSRISGFYRTPPGRSMATQYITRSCSSTSLALPVPRAIALSHARSACRALICTRSSTMRCVCCTLSMLATSVSIDLVEGEIQEYAILAHRWLASSREAYIRGSISWSR